MKTAMETQSLRSVGVRKNKFGFLVDLDAYG
jgi:hypothetical protein